MKPRLASYFESYMLSGLRRGMVGALMASVMFLAFSSSAATRTSIAAGGVWNSTTTWGGDPVPIAGDDVIIATTGGNVVTINVAAFCNNLTINTGAELTATTLGITVTGTWTNDGIYNHGTTSTITFSGLLAKIEGAGAANFRNISIASGALLEINTTVTVAGTFTYATPAASTNARVNIIGTNSVTVTGAMTINRAASNTYSCAFNVGDGTLTVLAAFSMTGSTGTRYSILEIGAGIANFGQFSPGGVASLINCSGNSTINISGTVGTNSATISPGTSTFNYTGLANQRVNASVYYDLHLLENNEKDLNTGTTTINNVLTIDAGTTLDINSNTLAFAGGGTYLVENGALNYSTGTIFYTGSGPQEILPIDYTNLGFSGAGTKSFPEATLDISGNLTVSSAIDFTALTTINVGGIVSGAGAITIGNGTMNVGGNWTNTGTTVPNASLVVVSSASAQTVRGNFYNLTLGGGGAKTLTATTIIGNLLSIEIGTTLTLTTLGLTFNASNAFVTGNGTLDPGASTAIISFSGPDAEIIPNLAYRNLTFGGAGTKTIANGTTLNIGLAWVIGAPTVMDGSANVVVGTSTSGTGALTMGTGTLTISTGTFASGTFTPGQGTVHFARNDGTAQTVRNTTYYDLEVSGTSLKTLANTTTITNTLRIDGSTFNFNSRSVVFSGGGDPIEIVNGGIYSGTTGVTSYTSVDPQNVLGLAYGGLTFSGAGAKTLTGNATVNGTFTNSTTSVIAADLLLSISLTTGVGNWANNSPITLTDGASISLTGSISGVGTITMGSGTITVGTNWTASGVLTPNTGRVHYNGALAQTVRGLTYNDLEFSGAGTKTMGNGTTATIGNNWIVDSPVTMTGTAGASVTGNISGAGSITQNTGTIALEGNWTNSGTFTSASTGIVLYDGANPQAVAGLGYGRLQFAGAGLKTLADGASVGNVLTFNTAATFNLSSHTLTLSGGGTPLVAGAGTLEPATSTVLYSSASATNIAALNYYNLDGTGGARTLPSSGTVGIANIFTPGAGAYTITNSTVHFNGAGEQTIPAFNYHNLNGTGGNRILAPGETIGIAGLFTPGGGSYQVATNTINFNGTTDQTIPAFTFHQVILSGSGQKIIDTVVTTNQIEIANGPTLNLNSTAGGILNITN